MPLFFSTMHYEPKYKQLNIIKQNQTNNQNPSRDILKNEIMARAGDELFSDKNPKPKPLFGLFPKKLSQFQNDILPKLKHCSGIFDLVASEVRLVKYVRLD